MSDWSRRAVLRSVLGMAGLGVMPGVAGAADPAAPPLLLLGDLHAGGVTALVMGSSSRTWSVEVSPAEAPEATLGRAVGTIKTRTSMGFTGSLDIGGLRPDSRLLVRLRDDDGSVVASSAFRVPPRAVPPMGLRLHWMGGFEGPWGLDPAGESLAVLDVLRKRAPDLSVVCGDRLNAGWVQGRQPRLLTGAAAPAPVVPPVLAGAEAVAETLASYRARYRRLHAMPVVQRWAAQAPVVATWDDGEVATHWNPGGWIEDPRYVQRDVDVLAVRARRAFEEHTALMDKRGPLSPLYRHLPWGELLDVFVLDTRSFRGPNSRNQQRSSDADTAFLGRVQLAWLVKRLKRSRARWKVLMAADDLARPLWLGGDSSVSRDAMVDGVANGEDGPALGRERELEVLLTSLHANRVDNVVWCSSGPGTPAAYELGGKRGLGRLVCLATGPLHGATSATQGLDRTFDPNPLALFPGAARPDGQPSADRQCAGELSFDGVSGDLMVRWLDGEGVERQIVQVAAR